MHTCSVLVVSQASTRLRGSHEYCINRTTSDCGSCFRVFETAQARTRAQKERGAVAAGGRAALDTSLHTMLGAARRAIGGVLHRRVKAHAVSATLPVDDSDAMYAAILTVTIGLIASMAFSFIAVRRKSGGQ